MRTRHSRDALLEVAVACAIDEGLSKATFGRVARRAGVPDRTVVYYFPTRDALLAAIVMVIAERLRTELDASMPAGRHPRARVVRLAWPVLAAPNHDRVFAVILELLGLASTGIEPYRGLAAAMIQGFVTWLADRIEGSTPADREAEAGAAIALIDGLLILRLTAGPEAAEAAAARLLPAPD
jgi:AcrR family transcriptional regulator